MIAGMASKHVLFRALPLMLAFVLGLGLPRSFLLLYAIEGVSCFLAWRQQRIAPTSILLCSTITLLGFGVTYVALRLSWGVWVPVMDHVQPVLAAALLPALGLMAGWCLQHLGGPLLSRRAMTWIIIAYGFGALSYVLISLGLTHSPWWDWLQPLSQSVEVPWGSDHSLNMRSVEQRGYIMLACLPSIFYLKPVHQGRHRLLAAALMISALLACVATWSFQSRIGMLVLLLSSLPWICSLKFLSKRVYTLVFLFAASIFIIASGRFCDERVFLQSNFLANVWQAPWGGRLIRFDYADCNPAITNHFGSFVGSNASSPHNVLLDIYNDAGILPFALMLASVSLIGIVVLRWFFLTYLAGGWDWHMAVRWAMFSALLVQFFAQPFMYSDQLMFSLAFFFLGMIMAEAFGAPQST